MRSGAYRNYSSVNHFARVMKPLHNSLKYQFKKLDDLPPLPPHLLEEAVKDNYESLTFDEKIHIRHYAEEKYR